MRPLVAFLAFALLAPVASAQVPDPAPVVDGACALLPGDVSDALPLCPRREPDVPVAPAARKEPSAPAPPQASPEDAQQLADDVKGQLEGTIEDPASAPDRLAAVVATVVRFVEDLLGLPQKVGGTVSDAVADAGAAAGGALAAAKEAAKERLDEARALVSSLWSALPTRPEPVEPPQAPGASDAKRGATSLVGDVLRTAGVPART